MRRTRKDKSVLSCLLRKEKHDEYKSDYRTGKRRAGRRGRRGSKSKKEKGKSEERRRQKQIRKERGRKKTQVRRDITGREGRN